MKKNVFFRGLIMAAMLVASVATYAGTALLPYGQYTNTAWSAKYFYMLNSEGSAPVNWYEADFDDSAWGTIQGPLGLNGVLVNTPTKWQANSASYWTRRTFKLSDLPESDEQVVFCVIHDDACTAYLNGVQIYNNTGASAFTYIKLTDEGRAALKVGTNVLAVYVKDTGSYADMDYGLYVVDRLEDAIVRTDGVNYLLETNETSKWYMDGMTAMVRGDGTTTKNASWLTLSYTANTQTEFSFSWASYNWSGHVPLELYIDGVKQNSRDNSGYQACRYYLPAGEHVVAFRDSIGNSSTVNNWCGVRDIKIKKITGLAAAALSHESAELTFVNNEATPWTTEGGYIEHTNCGVPNTASSIFSTFTVNKTSEFSFKRRSFCVGNTSYNSESCHQLKFIVNGVTIRRDWGVTEFAEYSMILEPGEYTVEWRDEVYNRSETYYSQLKDIKLSDNWQTVELATAGTLGYEALSLTAYDVLTDVEMLKIVGPLNAADWTDIKNMTNLKALDLSQAVITTIPNSAFDGKSPINSVILPEGITSIGEFAFRGTTIRRINIPSTVKTIGKNAFISTPLMYVTFAENSQLETISRYAFQDLKSLQSVDFGNMTTLKTIGYAAFADCPQLKEFIMPNSVTSLGYYQFNNNTSMTKLHLSDGMATVPDFICRNCTALTEVHMPANVTTIGRNAFESCTALKEINFPETLNTIQFQAFYNTGLEEVKIPIHLTNLGHQVFQNCQNLWYAELPSYVSTDSYTYISSYNYWGEDSHRTATSSYGWDNLFQNCPSIQKLVMRAATPPAVRNDITNGANAKSNITLVVPSFSVVNYKLDTYWYQYGTIIEGDDVDYWMLTSPLMLTNNRRMNGTPDVDLYFGGQLTIGGSAPFTMGKFNMFFNETNPGRLLNTTEAISATSATTKFAVDANKWYFFTPLHDVNVANITVSDEASFVFRYYDAQNRAVNGASGSWKNVDTDKLLAGQGYIFHCNKACTITFLMDSEGQKQLFMTKDVSRVLTVNEAETTANRSWNYIGNPYPCYYDIYYMDFTAPITVWTGSTYKAYSVADDELVLRPMQSFFVQKPDAVDEIIFHKEGRQLTTDINHAAAVKGQNAPQQTSQRSIFNIQIENENGMTDETRVVLNPVASMAYELTCDAAKFMSFDANVPQLLTLDEDGNSYAINERPAVDGLVTLAYYAGTAGSYTISALRAAGSVKLIDNELGTTTDLTAGSYTFQSEVTAEVNASRFLLMLGDGGQDAIQAVDGDKSSDTWYDLSGRKVANRTAHGVYIQNGRKILK